MSVVIRSDSRMAVANPMVDAELVECSSECSPLTLPPPPIHAHAPTNGMGVEVDMMSVTGTVGGCDIERISPSQVTPVSSDTLSSSPDTQPGKTQPERPRPHALTYSSNCPAGTWRGG
ncbi:putative FtzF1-like [Homarus americanus]|uniref:Putative FtzF1-like n=1 Tax=Homarus americanus TaxID=6706 RepID=A0A8J5JNU0_HOMAM|nr:putative FtzF1-like [Homarus americanus]